MIYENELEALKLIKSKRNNSLSRMARYIFLHNVVVVIYFDYSLIPS